MQQNIKSLEFLSFSIGGCFDGSIELTIQDNKYIVSKFDNNYEKFLIKLNPLTINNSEDHSFIIDDDSAQKSLTPQAIEKLIKTLNEINVLEWQLNYESPILDGTQWELKIKVNNNQKMYSFYGSNAYPGSVSELQDGSTTLVFEKLLDTFNEITNSKNF